MVNIKWTYCDYTAWKEKEKDCTEVYRNIINKAITGLWSAYALFSERVSSVLY